MTDSPMANHHPHPHHRRHRYRRHPPSPRVSLVDWGSGDGGSFSGLCGGWVALLKDHLYL
jgi:hypothetical protein